MNNAIKNKIIDVLNIDETYTKPSSKKVVYDKVKENIPHIQDYNFAGDLLMLPTTKENFKYLFVVVDLYSDEFDIEPLKTKTPDEILKAFKQMIKRDHIKKPYATLRTDGGNEFKGVFAEWLYTNNILHTVTEAGRHKQNGNVEALNSQLGRILSGYMNSKELITGKVYNEWTDIIVFVRKELNKIRRKPDNENVFTSFNPPPINRIPKYKVGQLVIRKLEIPKNALNNNQNTTKFRQGDFRWDWKEPKKIKQILFYPNNIRYMINGFAHVSYTEEELLPAISDTKDEKFAVKEIIGKRGSGPNIQYRIWWKGYRKIKDSTYEFKSQLIKDGLGQMIKDYEDSLL